MSQSQQEEAAGSSTPSSPGLPGGGGGVFQRLDRAERAPYRVSERLMRAAWTVVNRTVWRLARGWGGRWRGGGGWRRGVRRGWGARVGRGAVFRASAQIFHPWLFEIGEYSTLGPGVVIYNLGPVTIGSHTTISQDCYVCAGTHD